MAVVAEIRAIELGQHDRPPAGARNKAFAEYARATRVFFARAQRARNEFVKSNLRLVVSIARRFNHGRMPLSDLIQEGNIGLIKAVERYDYRRGYRFSTYASWWIRHSISRALADKGRAVRLPVHMLDAYHKVTRTSRELSSKLGRPPTPEEIGLSTGLPSDKVEKIQSYLLDQSLSLDRSVSDDDDRRFIELLQDPDGLSPTEKIMEQSVNEQVQEILGDLKPIEADVLRKRFGLAGGREQTLKEIGDSYQLSRERIRQIQEQALAKIRRALQRRNVL
jgi:RNA polymerase primary sigma factor